MSNFLSSCASHHASCIFRVRAQLWYMLFRENDERRNAVPVQCTLYTCACAWRTMSVSVLSAQVHGVQGSPPVSSATKDTSSSSSARLDGCTNCDSDRLSPGDESRGRQGKSIGFAEGRGRRRRIHSDNFHHTSGRQLADKHRSRDCHGLLTAMGRNCFKPNTWFN